MPDHHARVTDATSSAGRSVTRREALRRLGLLGLGLSSAGAVVAACSKSDDAQSASARRRSTPNVLLIIADDMRYDHLPYMPNVTRLIAQPGRAFTQARCNVPLCQPSRVGLFTGQMSKDNGELGIGYGGSKLKDHNNCVGKWMHDAGYRCGFFGKYVNWYDASGGIDPPAGYAVWRELLEDGDGYHLTVRTNDRTERITGTYSSDYLANQATKFIDGGEPFMAIVTPTQPHAPSNPRKDLAHKWSTLKWPIVDEVDVSDKPPWIQALPPLTAADRAEIQEQVRGALRELSAVDDMVHRIIGKMDPAVLDNTVVIFTSDNGVHHGEHRRRGAGTKSGPYEVGVHVPLLVRGPGFPAGADVTVPSMVMQDINATMLDIAGAKAGLPHQVGVSLAELCTDPGSHRSRLLLHEIGEGFVDNQTGDGVTTGPDHPLGFRKLYRYPSVRKNAAGPFIYEAYDLDTDRDELQSWANDPSRLQERNVLEAELTRLLS
jgi:arylsulfatase A-like enzyme